MKQTKGMLAIIAAAQFFPVSAFSVEAIADNIIVIGARTPVRINEIGSSVTVVSRDQIDQRQSVFIADLLQDVPGLSVSRAGGSGAQSQLRVRGAEANHVQVLIDGIEANDIAAGDEFRFAHLTSFDVERIEVVRGPQSALWGSDALAGVINIVTRKTRDGRAVGGFVDAGAFDTVSAGARAGGGGETGSFDIAASWIETNGTNIARNGPEDDGYDNFTASLQGGLNIIPDTLLVNAMIRHTDTRREFDEFDFLTGLQADSDRVTDARQTYAAVTTRLNLLDSLWQHTLRVTFSGTDDDNRIDGIWDSGISGDKLGFYYQSSFDLGRKTDLNQALTIAVDHEREDFKQQGIASFFGDPNREDDLNNTGYVLEYLVQPIEGLSVSIGLRHDDNSDFDNVTSYRTTTSYLIGKTSTRLRAGIGTGQKSPTFSERFGFFSDASSSFTGNAALKPEKSKAWEIGFDQDISQTARISMTYFNERLEDEIDGFFVTDPLTFAATAVNRSGISHRRGVEVSGVVQPVDALTIRLQYTYTDADEPGSTGADMPEIRRPRNSGSLNINYAFLNDRANANLNVSHTGDQYDTDFSMFPASQVTLDEYTLVNLAASVSLTDSISVYGRIENLFDAKYENVYGFATPGIGAYVGARMQFRD